LSQIGLFLVGTLSKLGRMMLLKDFDYGLRVLMKTVNISVSSSTQAEIGWFKT
jgi:hypothetical protein